MDSIKSLFRRSQDQENLVRTIPGMQPSDTGPTSEDEMKVIIDGFLGYIRALEQEVQGEVENAIRKESRRADDEAKNRLDEWRKDLDMEIEDYKRQKKQFELDLVLAVNQHNRTITELQSRNDSQNSMLDDTKAEVRALRDKIDSYSTEIESNEKRIEEQRAERGKSQDQLDYFFQQMIRDHEHMAELQSGNDSQNRMFENQRVEREVMAEKIHDYLEQIKSNDKRIAELQARNQSQKKVIHDQKAEIGTLQSEFNAAFNEINKLRVYNAELKEIHDRQANRIKDLTKDLKRAIYLDIHTGILTLEAEPYRIEIKIQNFLPTTLQQGVQLHPVGSVGQETGQAHLRAVTAINNARRDGLGDNVQASLTYADQGVL
ncbi:MAG: hypothetical protein Q9184_007855 [Pyrenodesmia sp. 2 TL-2023]